jgi:hypothetical protein
MARGVNDADVGSGYRQNIPIGQRCRSDSFVDDVPEHLVCRVQRDGGPGCTGESDGLTDVVVVSVCAHNIYYRASVHGGDDGLEFVSGIHDDDFAIITNQPDVVVDVPGATVEGKRATRHESFDPS